MPGFLGGGQNAQPQQPRQPFGPQLKQGLVAAAPLFAAMAAGYSSGRGPYAYLDQGMAGMQAMQKQKRDEEAAAAAAAAFGGLMPGALGVSGAGGGGGASPTYGAGGPVAPMNPNTPGALGDAAMAALGKPMQPAPEPSGWLKYSNQGAVRDDPLNPKLVEALSFLPELGVTADVMSGGQAAPGQGPRTGSTRHDHGNAADVDFYKDGRKLDWNNPQDMPVLTEIVRRAKASGVTGIGAGDDYMGAGRFHVGFGNPGVWGAGGKGANAPEWLVAAYNGSGGDPVSMSAKGEGATPVDPMSDPYVQKLMGVMAMPGLTPEQKSVVQLQLESRIGQLTAPNPAAEEERARAQRARDAEILGLQPGTAPFNQYVVTGEMPSAPKPIEVGGVLLDPNTMQPIFDSRQPKEGARPMTPQERAQWGIPETDTTPYKMTENGPVAIGSAGTTVNIDNAGGKFEEAFAKGDAATVETVYNAGLSAQRNLGRIDQLETLLANSPTGLEGAVKQVAGEWGVSTDGLDAIQSAQALINSLVPEQRQPGSGPMSDADLALFKQSLPRIINQTGGNKIIVDTMRTIAQYDAEGARIVQRLRNGELTRAQAFDALQNRPNPLAQYSAGAAPAASGAPAPGSVMKFDANGNIIP